MRATAFSVYTFWRYLVRLSSWHPLLITTVACVASFHLYRASSPAQAEPLPPKNPHFIARSEKN